MNDVLDGVDGCEERVESGLHTKASQAISPLLSDCWRSRGFASDTNGCRLSCVTALVCSSNNISKWLQASASEVTCKSHLKHEHESWRPARKQPIQPPFHALHTHQHTNTSTHINTKPDAQPPLPPANTCTNPGPTRNTQRNSLSSVHQLLPLCLQLRPLLLLEVNEVSIGRGVVRPALLGVKVLQQNTPRQQ